MIRAHPGRTSLAYHKLLRSQPHLRLCLSLRNGWTGRISVSPTYPRCICEYDGMYEHRCSWPRPAYRHSDYLLPAHHLRPLRRDASSLMACLALGP